MDASFCLCANEMSDSRLVHKTSIHAYHVISRHVDISRSQKIHMHVEAAQYVMAQTFTISELVRPET